MDVVADSPDPSRWLVVTQGEVVIEDMTFYHAGDVIVAGNGTLIFRNAELVLVQSQEYERTVYVDGDARLVFENSVVLSELPINFVTLGSGVLETIDSQFEGVNIVALENSMVYLNGTTFDGTITNAWDSHATVNVFDSELDVSPVLSGYAIGSFTNTSLPSVIVQDDAIGYIYRWIHVTVYDGANHTLPGALVSARWMFNDTYMASATTDSIGVALINSLASIITVDNPNGKFVGTYTVNATYWYAGTPYESDGEVDLSVLPYSEPLGSNATYSTLAISSTLPDLAIDMVGGVVASPESPKKGQETTITAFVRNDGVVGAYDVLVEFYHEVYGLVDMIGTVTVPLIGPGETMEVSAVWIAVEPLDYPHNISVVIDPLNTIPELDETLATGYVLVVVQKLPDIMIEPTEIVTDNVPVIGRLSNLMVTVRNAGDAYAYDVWVDFYNGSVSPSNLIGTALVDQIAPGGSYVAGVPWTPTIAIPHTISVTTNGNATFDEITFDNNNRSRSIDVLDRPDLALSGMYFSNTSATVEGGRTIIALAELINLEPAPFPYPVVAVYIDAGSGLEEVDTVEISDTLTESSQPIVVQWVYSAPIVDEATVIEIYFEVNPDQVPEEQNYSNNVVHATLTILDVREDFAVDSAGLSVQSVGVGVTTEVFGKTVAINANVSNLGARGVEAFSVVFGVLYAGNNWTIDSITPDLAGGTTEMFTVNWTINITVVGEVVLWISLDVENAYLEQNESNNFASIGFTIGQLSLLFEILVSDTEFKAGEIMVVEGYVSYSLGGMVPNLVGLQAELRDADDNVVEGTDLETAIIRSDAGGYFAVTFTIPAELESGDYTIVMSHPDAIGEGESDPVLITGVVAGRGIPLILWIIVIAAIVAVVAGFTIYTYVYGLGKLVECGECGAFIPAASKRCPKCGVEFEANTMKCSECGAWVPADSTECLNCGVKFVGEGIGEDEGDYLERMRKEYDEMVSKYRELAKAELGKKFSDKKFDEWWRLQPTFITFDDWLAKEEEKRKEGPVPCPVCGTLNPKEATVCHKCGTVFGERKEEPPSRGAPPTAPESHSAELTSAEAPQAELTQAQVAPAAAPKMVIRRPIDRKVVPKKIIKTPVGGTDEKSENGSGGDESQ
jgi:ribosomal protein L40E